MSATPTTRILIIDDDAKIRSIYARFLTDEGYDVVEAKDAREATFKMIQMDNEIALILLDINMPDIDGSYMKQVIDAWDPTAKIIVSSVYPLEEQKIRVPNAKAYHDKSKGADILLKKIKKVLRLPREGSKVTFITNLNNSEVEND